MLMAVLISLFMFNAQVVFAMDLVIRGKQAKKLYIFLTGPAVQHNGAAGHLYSQGTSILCRYTDVDITRHGQSISATDPSRYVCSMTFNANGLASPGPNPS